MSPDELLAAVLAPAFLVYTGLNVALLVPLTLLSPTEWGARWIGIDVGTCALYGGYTVMATKALSSLLGAVFLKAFAYPIAWVAVFVLVATSVLQIKYLNRALMRFESKVGCCTLHVELTRRRSSRRSLSSSPCRRSWAARSCTRSSAG